MNGGKSVKAGTKLMIPVKGIIQTVFNVSANHEPTRMNNTVANATVLIISSGPNNPSRVFVYFKLITGMNAHGQKLIQHTSEPHN